MANNQAEITSAAVSGGAAALSAGRPAEEVVIWAVFGAIVAVWLNSRGGGAVTARWVLNATFVLIVSVLCGIVGSAMFVAVAPEYEWTKPLGRVPQWTAAFVIAATIHVIAPLAYSVFARWTQKQGTQDGGA